MDIKTYHLETARTSPPLSLVADGAPKEIQIKMSLLLGVIGLADESGEVLELMLASRDPIFEFPANFRKELGDVYWYSSHICHVLQMNLNYIAPSREQVSEKIQRLGALAVQNNRSLTVDFVVENLVIETTKGMLGTVKKMLFHGHPFEPVKIFDQLTEILATLEILCLFAATPPEQVWDENIAKLHARYPEKFEVERSLHKDESNE